MEPEAQKHLDDILAKDPTSLTREDRDFLRARKSYVAGKVLRRFQSVLNQKEEAIVPAKVKKPVDTFPGK